MSEGAGTLEDTPEWRAYVSSPSSATLGHLVESAEVAGRGDTVIPALYDRFRQSPDWKTAQHLSQLCCRADHAMYATFFAMRAVDLSGGNPFARVSLAEAHWMRRIPEVVLQETRILRVQARRLRRPIRAILQSGIANLVVRAHAYAGHIKACHGYSRLLARTGRGTRETWAMLLIVAWQCSDDGQQSLAIAALAPFESGLGGRVQIMMRVPFRNRLLDIFRRRLSCL